jgi:hypothetical protein
LPQACHLFGLQYQSQGGQRVHASKEAPPPAPEPEPEVVEVIYASPEDRGSHGSLCARLFATIGRQTITVAIPCHFKGTTPFRPRNIGRRWA